MKEFEYYPPIYGEDEDIKDGPIEFIEVDDE